MSRASWATPVAQQPLSYKLIARLGGYYDLKYYRHCNYLIGNTQDIVDHIVKAGFAKERAVYLPNFVHAPSREAVSRLGFDTPIDVPLLLAMGRLHENKGFDVLLHAMVEMPDHWLWIAGEGPEGPALSQLASELGVADRVRFLGWRDDSDALMQACDMFVCSSRHEPLGNIVLEAWASGKPVVAAAAAGPSGLIGANEAGLLVPVEDPKALAQGIVTLSNDADLAGGLAAEGHARFLRDYTEDAVVAKYLAFFESVR
jgi:glycosyltransferase involved in cell wall biosynthesis